MLKNAPKKSLLCILDGFAIGYDSPFNAFKTSNANYLKDLLVNYPWSELSASGENIGLPDAQIGNSEVGHMCIGSGRILLQDLSRINQAIKDEYIVNHEYIKSVISNCANKGSKCHIIGLFSDGGVHSHIDHIMHLVSILSSSGVEVVLHGFLDGRDVDQKSAINYIKLFNQSFRNDKKVMIGTMMGRYYAMDRDNRWERIEKAYKAIVRAEGAKVQNFEQYIKKNYKNNITDEFIEPGIDIDYDGMLEGDAVIFANFRADRVRQLSNALLDNEFYKFTRGNKIEFSDVVAMTEYSEDLSNKMKILFKQENIENTLGEVISALGLKQLRIAETEKYAHVTFFFNGGKEDPMQYEDRELIPSPKVATYDLAPEMSSIELTDALINSIKFKDYNLIVANYANCDMVGHSGNIDAARKAVEAVDSCLAKFIPIALDHGYNVFLTSDHGNIEHMRSNDGHPHTAHTTNPVPFVFISSHYNKSNVKISSGNLSDIAPTILHIMGIEIPKEMTGKILLKL